MVSPNYLAVLEMIFDLLSELEFCKFRTFKQTTRLATLATVAFLHSSAMALEDGSAERLTSLNQSGTEAFQKQDYVKADQIFSEALILARKSNTPKLAISAILLNLGVSETYNGKPAEAQAHLKESVQIRSALLGLKNPATQLAMKHYAALMEKSGESGKASNIYGLIGAINHQAEAPQRPTRRRDDSSSEPESQPAGLKCSIKNLIKMSSTDADNQANPTVGRRQVLDHYEWQTFYNQNNQPYSRQVPVMRNENYKVSEDSDLEYVKSIEQLCRDHKLQAEQKYLIYAVKNGAAILELDNDMVILVAQDVSTSNWYNGTDLSVSEHPKLSLPYVALLNASNGETLGGKVIAAR